MHLIKLLSTLETQLLPTYILIENVACFENSQTHSLLTETLNNQNYNFQEFLLSPTQFGIPNQRLRYFCLVSKFLIKQYLFKYLFLLKAKLSPLGFTSLKTPNNENNIFRFLPGFENPLPLKPLCRYLEDGKTDEEMLKLYGIKESVLKKSGRLFDIKNINDTNTNCFTKSYGRYVEGSGSVIETNPIEKKDAIYTMEEELEMRKLRYFSPREMLNLHGFPKDFKFPPDITFLQAYKLIGNSLNVHVVKELIAYLLKEPQN